MCLWAAVLQIVLAPCLGCSVRHVETAHRRCTVHMQGFLSIYCTRHMVCCTRLATKVYSCVQHELNAQFWSHRMLTAHVFDHFARPMGVLALQSMTWHMLPASGAVALLRCEVSE
jgi:hypothetical protein